MKRYLITIVNLLTNIYLKIFNRRPTKKFLANTFSFFNKLYNTKNSKVIYNENSDLYFHKTNEVTFYIESKPKWNISFIKLKKQKDNLHCLFYKPEKGHTIIEIGAGVGTETIVLGTAIAPAGVVYAIEAHPETFKKLDLLSELNPTIPIKPVHMAITSESGKVFINDQENHAANSINRTTGFSVDGKTLDDFVRENKINEINFLKVNIEGAELEMIKGMKRGVVLIKNFATSCHDFLFENNDKPIKNTLQSFFEEHGFEIHPFSDNHIVRNSWLFGSKT